MVRKEGENGSMSSSFWSASSNTSKPSSPLLPQGSLDGHSLVRDIILRLDTKTRGTLLELKSFEASERGVDVAAPNRDWTSQDAPCGEKRQD